MSRCASCGNDTHETILDRIDYNPVEATTICFGCGWSDYWSYGHYFGDVTSDIFDHKLTRKMKECNFWTKNSTKESGIDYVTTTIKESVKSIITTLRQLTESIITSWYIR